MTTVVTIHQPNFMLWTKLLDKILASDVYVAYDTVQYTKSEYHSRQKIRNSSGEMWLSVPVIHDRYQPLESVRIDDQQRFRRKHLRTIHQEYRRSPHFDDVYRIVSEVYDAEHDHLVDLNLALIEGFCRYLQSPVRVIRASSLPHEGDNTDRLIQLVRGAGGSHHLTSTYGTEREYIDWTRVMESGIGLCRPLSANLG